jgi:serine/threonine protein kinase
MLYKMVTGELPFKGSITLAILSALAIDTPKEPRELNPEVPAPLNALILRLLARKAADRPTSAG